MYSTLFHFIQTWNIFLYFRKKKLFDPHITHLIIDPDSYNFLQCNHSIISVINLIL
jgi:hypothetical protein